MKKYKLVISNVAALDLKNAAEWYSEQKSGLEEDFLDEIEKSIMRIQSNPQQFPFVRKQIRMSIVKRFPYGIYFFETFGVINVIAVFHFSRNPKIIRKRGQKLR